MTLRLVQSYGAPAALADYTVYGSILQDGETVPISATGSDASGILLTIPPLYPGSHPYNLHLKHKTSGTDYLFLQGNCDVSELIGPDTLDNTAAEQITVTLKDDLSDISATLQLYPLQNGSSKNGLALQDLQAMLDDEAFQKQLQSACRIPEIEENMAHKADVSSLTSYLPYKKLGNNLIVNDDGTVSVDLLDYTGADIAIVRTSPATTSETGIDDALNEAGYTWSKPSEERWLIRNANLPLADNVRSAIQMYRSMNMTYAIMASQAVVSDAAAALPYGQALIIAWNRQPHPSCVESILSYLQNAGYSYTNDPDERSIVIHMKGTQVPEKIQMLLDSWHSHEDYTIEQSGYVTLHNLVSPKRMIAAVQAMTDDQKAALRTALGIEPVDTSAFVPYAKLGRALTTASDGKVDVDLSNYSGTTVNIIGTTSACIGQSAANRFEATASGSICKHTSRSEIVSGTALMRVQPSAFHIQNGELPTDSKITAADNGVLAMQAKADVAMRSLSGNYPGIFLNGGAHNGVVVRANSTTSSQGASGATTP